MNVFFISTFGHIFHAVNTINIIGLRQENVKFVITYSNKELADKIYYKLIEMDYENIEQVEVRLPRLCMKTKTYDDIYCNISKIIEEPQAREVYICAYESYYTIIYKASIDLGVHVSLFEEGVGSYKYLVNDDKKNGYITILLLTIYIVLIKNPLQSIRACLSLTCKFIKKMLNININILRGIKNVIIKGLRKTKKEIYKYFKALKTVVFRILRTYIRISKVYFNLLSEYERKQIAKAFVPKKYQYTTSFFKEYHNIYVTHPDRIREIFSAENYIQIPIKYDITEIEKELLENSNYGDINDESYIFINQAPYISSLENHIKTIIEYVKYKDYKKVYLKLHPRESVKTQNIFKEYIEEHNVDIEILDMNINIPFEKILTYKSPKKLIGLTSSIFLYAKFLSNTTEVELCDQFYVNKNNKFIEKSNLAKLEYHAKILKMMR